jgi:hypothetical protein
MSVYLSNRANIETRKSGLGSNDNIDSNRLTQKLLCNNNVYILFLEFQYKFSKGNETNYS